MAASNSDPDRSPKKDDGPDNPFVAFRRFADAQVSSIVDNVYRGLGIFQQSNLDRRQREIDDFELKARRNASLNQDEYQRRLQEARLYLHARDLRNTAAAAADDETSPMRADCEDDDDDDSENLYGGMRCPYRPTEKKHAPSDQMLRPSALDVYYVFHSEYSPIALERQDIFREHSGKMRAAFADLVAMQEGEGLLPGNTIEKNTQRSPFCWAVDMVRMINLGRPSSLGGTLDRKLPDGQSMEPHISYLLATRPFFGAEQAEESDWREEKTNHAEAEDTSEAQEGARFLQCIRAGLAQLGDQNREEDISNEEQQEEVLKIQEQANSPENDADDNNDGPKSCLDWAANYLPFAPDFEQDEADDNDCGCVCVHCMSYERRRDEYRQWRREELGELDDTDVDEERTTNPTSELDHYHALADFQAKILKNVQERNPSESAATTAAPSGSLKRNNEDDKQLRELTPSQPSASSSSSVIPSILSTLTTTEQRTLPDGTVTTKVVLKKRFSDGAEEVTERVHTQNAPSPSPSSSVESQGNLASGKVKDGMTKQKKDAGWFWS